MSRSSRFSAQQANINQRHSFSPGASPIARLSLLIYTVLIIVASLFPFAGWRDMGIPAFAYLSAEWPRRELRFDVVVNILGYLPLGLLASFSMFPRLRPAWAVLPASLYCAGLSCCLEALQTWLPARVPSKVDLLTNSIGGLMGALLAIGLARPLLVRGRLRDFRNQCFEKGGSLGLVLIVLWFGALAYPEPFALGIGGVVKPLLDSLPESWGIPMLQPLVTSRFILAEASVCALTLIGAGALMLSLTRPRAPKKWLVLLFVVLTILAKLLSQGMAYEDEGVFSWITEGATWGLGIGLFILLILSAVPARLCAWVGVVALLVAVSLNNVLPENPYYDINEHVWAYGRLLNFYGLTIGLSYVWPFWALGYLIYQGSRPRFKTL